jgi:hypothetical protein
MAIEPQGKGLIKGKGLSQVRGKGPFLDFQDYFGIITFSGILS